ncbi:MAG: DUF255 domain-containing protein [Magnetococcus sp. DMHC-6]
MAIQPIMGNENRLGNSQSPYLRQHASEAIHWQPWGTAALKQAKEEDKLILLTIGYLACHWCRVMSEETFADAEVITRLNDHFIPILVDREERADLDTHYLAVAQRMMGRSGWPQFIFLTPDLLPLFAGNYFPPEDKNGQTGFRHILRDLAKEWQENRAALLSNEERTKAQLQSMWQLSSLPGGEGDPRQRAAQRLRAILTNSADNAPRFPRPTALSFLLRHGVRTHDQKLLDEVHALLEAMAAGGIRDILGGLFHRYSVDAAWQKPHYEIMLLDNALLARVYLEAYQVFSTSGDALVAQEIFEGIFKQLQVSQNNFGSSLAADSPDSQGKMREGTYYQWTPSAIKNLLGDAGLQKIQKWLHIEDGPLRWKGPRIPWNDPILKELTPLRQARAQRSAPQRDDKIITSQNALLASSLALGARVLAKPEYLQVAKEILLPLTTYFRKHQTLPHMRLEHTWGETGFLDAYAFTIQALLDIYESDFDLSHLELAREMAEVMQNRFRSKSGPWWKFTADESQELIFLEDREGLPTANNVAWSTLARLSKWQAQEEKRQQQLYPALPEAIQHSSELLRAVDYLDPEAIQVIVVGSPFDPMTQLLTHEVSRRLLPGAVWAVLDPTSAPPSPHWPALIPHPLQKGQPTAYLCHQNLCQTPVTTIEALREQLAAIGYKAP